MANAPRRPAVGATQAEEAQVPRRRAGKRAAEESPIGAEEPISPGKRVRPGR